jgi:hypothetical protein
MARTTGSGNYLSGYSGSAGLLGSATTASFACWIYPTATSSNIIASNWNFSGATASSFFTRINSSTQFRVSISNGTAETAANFSGGTISTSVWSHWAWAWDGSVLTAYLNGSTYGSTVAFTGTMTVSPATDYWLGSSAHNTAQAFAGRLAEVGIWKNITLSADEVKGLSRGYTPPLIRRNGLVFYADLLSNNRDQITQTDPSVTGSVTASDHPTQTILPMSPIYHPKGAGGGGGGGNPLWWPARAGSIGELTGGIYA